MNRLILKFSYQVTFVILAILAWFAYRQFIIAKSPFIPFIAVAGVLWAVGAFLFIYFWPTFSTSAYKRVILEHGLGGGPIPINTIYAVPAAASAASPSSSLLATGANELLYFGGWLDLSKGAQVLHVPDFSSRYYSIQFTNPADGSDFAYVGKLATGTRSGDFLITGPGWQGAVPQGMKQIASPNHSAMLLGRALVNDDRDVAAVYELAKQVQLRAFSFE